MHVFLVVDDDLILNLLFLVLNELFYFNIFIFKLFNGILLLFYIFQFVIQSIDILINIQI
jgi:hypothetical protein